jgi:hypothetical protein
VSAKLAYAAQTLFEESLPCFVYNKKTAKLRAALRVIIEDFCLVKHFNFQSEKSQLCCQS